MDKKVIYGLGAVALLGAVWYFKKKKDEQALASMGDMGAMAETPAEEGGAGGGAGGGGGAVPSPTDEAVGEMAKEGVKKSMDLGGLDMASKKVEKSAKVTAMVGSMASQGKSVPKDMVKAVMKAPIPKGLKGKILSASSGGIKPAVKSGIGKVTSAVKSATPSIKAKFQGLKSKFKKFDGFDDYDSFDNFDGDDMMDNFSGGSDF